jgi:excisionase family DNA binding protein
MTGARSFAPTTKEVAEMLDVNMKTLQFWVREGFIDAVKITGEGRQRRIEWTEDGIEQARKMKDRAANGSAVADVYGTDLLTTMRRAKEMKDYQSPGNIIVASPKTARLFRDDRSLGDVLRTIPGTFLIILR